MSQRSGAGSIATRSTPPAQSLTTSMVTADDLDIDSGTLSIDEVNNRVVIGNDIQMGDGKSIVDSNGNELLKFCEVGSAANYVEVENAADGASPALSALGDSANINISMRPKGTGGVRVYGTTASAATLYLNEDTDNGTNFMGLRANTSIGTSHTYVWPAALPASPKILQSQSDGTLGWVDEAPLANNLNVILHNQVFS